MTHSPQRNLENLPSLLSSPSPLLSLTLLAGSDGRANLAKHPSGMVLAFGEPLESSYGLAALVVGEEPCTLAQNHQEVKQVRHAKLGLLACGIGGQEGD